MRKPPFLEAIRAETARVRDDLATAAYGVDAVRAAIAKAAGEGLEEARIAPPKPLDLRDTAAAAAIQKHLEDSGFRVVWDARPVETGGQRLTAVDLVVDWREAEL